MAIAEIDLRRDLPKVRANINMAGLGECRYASPCAVGAMIDDPADRALLDLVESDEGEPQSTFKFLRSLGALVCPDDEQARDLEDLQSAFDGFDAEYFAHTLARLEAKYLTSGDK